MAKNEKFKRGLVEEIEAENAERENQQRLREKHGVEDQNKIVVEKSSAPRVILTIFRIIAEVILLCLAAVGVIALIYKEPRADLIQIFLDMKKQLLLMI